MGVTLAKSVSEENFQKQKKNCGFVSYRHMSRVPNKCFVISPFFSLPWTSEF